MVIRIEVGNLTVDLDPEDPSADVFYGVPREGRPTQLTGTDLIALERARQMLEEGYSGEHDDLHADGEMSAAAACYAAPCPIFVEDRDFVNEVRFRDPWPWDDSSDRRRGMGPQVIDNSTLDDEQRVRQLAKAGALVAAEIDRLRRKQ